MSEDVRWLATHEEDGVVLFRIGRRGDRVVAEWIGVATLVAREDGTDASLTFTAEARPAEREKIERGTARLLLRHLQKKLALHGAAVARDGRAVILLGRSGAGKSTLAAALCERPGLELVADDACSVELDARPLVLGAELHHWLDPASRQALALSGSSASKQPVRARATAERAEIVALVDLAFDDGADAPRLVPIAGLEALAALLPQVARFVLDDPSAQQRELEQLETLLARVPILRLERRRDLATLGDAVDVVLGLWSSAPEGPR